MCSFPGFFTLLPSCSHLPVGRGPQRAVAIISALFATLGNLEGNWYLVTCNFHCLAQIPETSPGLLFEQHLYVKEYVSWERSLHFMVLSHVGAAWAAVTSVLDAADTTVSKNMSVKKVLPCQLSVPTHDLPDA